MSCTTPSTTPLFHRRGFFFFAVLAAFLLATPLIAGSLVDDEPVDLKPRKVPCHLLDDPEAADLADGLRFRLMKHCDEGSSKPPTEEAPPRGDGDASSFLKARTRAALKTGGDVQVNDSTGESGGNASQSETTLARNPNNGTICSLFMDLHEFFNGTGGIIGHARSTDGGASFVDLGHLGGDTFGDPVVVWRQADSAFYVSALNEPSGVWGVDLWKSTNDCVSFGYVGRISTGNNHDRPFLLVDNHPSSPWSGRLYSAYRTGTNISIRWSDNGGASWSAPAQIGPTFGTGFSSSQGVYLAVDPGGSGKLYAAYTKFTSNGAVNNEIDIATFSSTNGGASWATLGEPLSNAVRSREPSTPCPSVNALEGGMRHVPTPQLAVDVAGNVHVVYNYDPDGFGTGDTADVFYSRSTTGGVFWSPEVRLNDDTSTSDQYHPTLSANPSSQTVVATWYDRRQDPSNLRFAVYQRISTDGGATWGPNLQVSDLSTNVRIDDGATGNCFHGDYDQQIQTDTQALIQWSDDRNLISGHADADVFFDRQHLPNAACCVSGLSAISFSLGNTATQTRPETTEAFCALGAFRPASWTGSCAVDDSQTGDGFWTLNTQSATAEVHCVERSGGCPPSPYWHDFSVYGTNDIAIDGDQYAYCAIGEMKRLVGGGSCGSSYDAAANSWRFTGQDADCRFLCIRRDAVCPGFATTAFAVDGRSAPASQSVSTNDYAYCAAATISPSYTPTPICDATLDTVNNEWDLSASGAFCRFLCIDD